MRTPLPLAPWELDGDQPRIYVVHARNGDQLVSRERYLAAPHNYPQVDPVKLVINFDPDLLVNSKCGKPLGATLTSTGYEERYNLVHRTPEERAEFIIKVKTHLVRDIHVQGIPTMHFPDSRIELEYESTRYLVELEDLTDLNKYLYPRQSQRTADIFQVYTAGLMDSPLVVPARDLYTGELGSLEIGYNTGAMTVAAYTEKSREYLATMNNLCKLILGTDLHAVKLSELWKTVYGTSMFKDVSVERVKM